MTNLIEGHKVQPAGIVGRWNTPRRASTPKTTYADATNRMTFSPAVGMVLIKNLSSDYYVQIVINGVATSDAARKTEIEAPATIDGATGLRFTILPQCEQSISLQEGISAIGILPEADDAVVEVLSMHYASFA